jgi:hypothetical protein
VQRSKFEAFAVSGEQVSFLMLLKVCQRWSRNACNLPSFESSLINGMASKSNFRTRFRFRESPCRRAHEIRVRKKQAGNHSQST